MNHVNKRQVHRHQCVNNTTTPLLHTQLQEEVRGAGSVFAVEGTMGLGRALQAALGGPQQCLEKLQDAARIEDGVATVYVMDAIMQSSAAGGAPVAPKQLR